MSLVDLSGAKVDLEVDKPALALRDAIAGMDLRQRRTFAVNLMRAGGVPIEDIARTMRCSVVTARRDGRHCQED